MKNKIWAFLFLFAVLAVLLIIGLAEQKTGPPAYYTYLPIISNSWGGVLKGVGLSGPCAAVGGLGVTWYYTWGSAPCQVGDTAFVPMIWGRIHPLQIPAKVEMARNTSGWLLGFNEPDQPSQANISPGEAAILWRQIENAADGVRLVSPVPSQEDPGWLWQMVAEYESLYGEKPRFDAIATHYYCWEGDWIKARDYLISIRQQAVAHDYGNSQIWLTEFGGECWTPNNHNEEIMRNLIPWMKSQSWMGRYAWFASMLPDPPATLDLEYCSLTDPLTGELTSLGERYREVE